MGVQGLDNFVCSFVPGGTNFIDIRKEIHTWLKSNVNCLIVFDVKSFIVPFIENNESTFNIICGGRHQKLLDLCDNFFRGLVSFGAELAFFTDGSVIDRKVNEWLKRQNNRYRESIKVYDRLNAGLSVREPTRCGGTVMIFEALADICKRYGVYQTIEGFYDQECDEELAKYATQNNALAVFAFDSDYLCNIGNWQYWSSLDLKIQNWTTLDRNRRATRMHLSLDEREMPILSALVGNDRLKKLGFVDNPFLKFKNRNKVIMEAAAFIRTHSNEMLSHTDNDLNILKEFVRMLNMRDRLSQEEVIKLLRKSIQTYRSDLKSDKVIINKNENSAQRFKLNALKNRPIQLQWSIFDARNKAFNPKLMLEILQRKLGLIDGITDANTVMTKMDHKTPYERYKVKPIRPSIDFTSKWKRLSWLIFGKTTDTLDIEKIPPGYKVVILAVRLLYQNQSITRNQANSILVTVAKAKNKMISANLEQSTTLKSDNVMAAHLYINCHLEIITCFQMVELDNFIDHCVFDGVHFQCAMNKPQLVRDYISNVKNLQQLVFLE